MKRTGLKCFYLLPFLGLLAFAASERVEITSDKFEADERTGVTKFIGHVHMKKGRDELNASKVAVYFDTGRKPKRYEAIGRASFTIFMKKEGQLYTGRADRLVYFPAARRYELYGNVVLKEPRLERTVTGQKVIVDKTSGKASVEGGKKPVKFIFKVDENNASTDR